ncbi:HDIG domain-containing protein, partial [bacterium]|nr:HDIG domain-containing protein [bacterium]
VLAVYDYDRRILSEKKQKIVDTIKQLHTKAAELLKDTKYKNIPRLRYLTVEQSKEIKTIFEDGIGVKIDEKSWGTLIREDLSSEVEASLIHALTRYSNFPIIGDNKELLKEERGITVRQIFTESEKTKDEQTEYQLKDVKGVLTLENVKSQIKPEDIKGKFLYLSTPKSITTILKGIIVPNFTFNREEMEARQTQSARSIKSVLIKIQAGESIIRSGARYEPWHIKVLDGIRKEKESSSVSMKFLGTFMLVFLIILTVFYFAEKFLSNFDPSRKDMLFMCILLLVELLLLRIALSITSAIHDSILYDVPLSAFFYIIPVAAGTMLTRMVLNSETSIIFALVSSLIIGIFAESNFSYGAFTLISSIVAITTIANADKRANIIKAGALLGILNIFLVLAFRLLNTASIVDTFSFTNIIWYIVFAFISGIGSAFFVLIATPIAESLFDYTTDIKLLELANLNHPLLRELIIRAPGTYHHSHLVGILSEAAAESMGANSLLSRVAAYYHDIGKIKKPFYFTENQKVKDDRYDKLSPHMSALIIQSHVKDGLEMAKQYKLPRVIMDMIPQHHGTKMVSFFYNKAKEQEDPKHQVQEKDFRYPGPKPQTREAGILLLADATEAAVRSLKEKSTTRIQETVQNIIDKSFSEGQLDECDLTLRDLNLIAQAFARIAMGIYHQRIEYPTEEAKPDNPKQVKVINEETIGQDLDPESAPKQADK